jgi:hypothetical protein
MEEMTTTLLMEEVRALVEEFMEEAGTTRFKLETQVMMSGVVLEMML